MPLFLFTEYTNDPVSYPGVSDGRINGEKAAMAAKYPGVYVLDYDYSAQRADAIHPSAAGYAGMAAALIARIAAGGP